jgi:hypothetical protein
MISFAAPLVLAGLIALPVIWYLLRVTPPPAKRVSFFGLRFLLGLKTDEDTPSKTPWWLLALRLCVAGLAILALSGPVLNAARLLASTDRTLVVVVDDGWAAAHAWDARKELLRRVIDEAAAGGRRVAILPAASPDFDVKLEDPASALGRAMGLEPQPLEPDYAAALAKLDAASPGEIETVWLASGIGGEAAKLFGETLGQRGPLAVYQDDVGGQAIALLPATPGADSLTVPVVRARPGIAQQGIVRAYGEQSRFLGEAPFAFDAAATRTEAVLALPSEIRNAVERVEIAGRTSAGAVVLLDETSRRRPVGVVPGDTGGVDQPLLSSTFYLERALETSAEVRLAPLADHLKRGVSILMLSDVGVIAGEDYAAARAWVERGGVLVRFAGPRLAARADDLLPVRLRPGGARAMGGALSWEQAQSLAPFPKESPFAGIAVAPGIAVSRQVLAEPSLDLQEKTWATLADGTPLVTAARLGEGWIVLFHVTANAEWSSLALSGTFVDMLQRLVALGRGLSADAEAEAADRSVLAPRLLLDGYGRLVPPSADALPIRRDEARVSAEHHPGLYGDGAMSLALNLFAAGRTLTPLALPDSALQRGYALGGQTDLKPWAIGFAILLALLDAVISLWLRGYRIGRLGPATAAMLALAAALHADPARAQDTKADEFAMQAALETRLAYVRTGDAELDRMSQLGLEGLTRILGERTAVMAGEPLGIDIATDELAFFPLLYWPIPDAGLSIDDATIARIDLFMKNGGTIVFDTRDGDGLGPASAALEYLLKRLDLPPLERVPADHVLTKSFYLLSIFPGRHTDGAVWVQAAGDGEGATSEALGDGVSSVVIGAADWAPAWAMDEFGRGLVPMGSGGERQQELALRFGVNLVMYALTGNYKADQVHLPALLERLGQ